MLADSHEMLSTLEQKVSPAYAALLVIDREAGVLVIFIQAIYDPQYLLAPMRERDLHVGARMPRCLMGSWGADFHVVARRANEPVVIKHRYSAFANSELDDLLKRHGIRNLLLAGVATDTCAESTGRDAYFIDYYVTLVADCCAGARSAITAWRLSGSSTTTVRSSTLPMLSRPGNAATRRRRVLSQRARVEID